MRLETQKARRPALASRGSLLGSRLANDVYKRLTDAIADMRLAPGQRLREAVLAREFGVSRTPVREALQILVREGLATASPAGIAVTELTVKDVRDFYQTAEVLQGLACRLAAERGTEQQMARLEKTMVEMESAAACNDVARWTVADNLLHEHIVRMADNLVVSNMGRQIETITGRVRYLALHQPGRLQQSTHEHRGMVDAIRARDPELAAQRTQEHLQIVEGLLLGILQNYIVPFKGARF